jgi:hypothetical protein
LPFMTFGLVLFRTKLSVLDSVSVNERAFKRLD